MNATQGRIVTADQLHAGYEVHHSVILDGERGQWTRVEHRAYELVLELPDGKFAVREPRP